MGQIGSTLPLRANTLHQAYAVDGKRSVFEVGEEGSFAPMEAVKIESDGSIQLPKRVLRRFPKRSELAVWTEGDVIVLKRLKPAKLSAIAARRPEKEMPLAEIDAEVQAHRKEKRARKA